MYRNESILMDEIRAASRVMELAETLYRVSPVRSGVMDTADRWGSTGLAGKTGTDWDDRRRERMGSGDDGI